MPNAADAQQATTCRKCQRPLTSLRSIREAARNGGYGRGCARKIDHAAQASTDQPAQVAKATQLIEDGALDHVAGSTWLAVSSDGSTRYEVDAAAGTCSCPAGQHGRRCYHAIAVEFVTGRPVVAPALVADPFARLPRDIDPFADAA